MMRRRVILGAGMAGLVGSAQAQVAAGRIGVAGWPSRPVKLVVGFAAGGATDIYARMVADRLTALGQATVVENRPGAAGVLANEAVARSTDGHTFLMTSSSFSVSAALRAGQLPYDVLKDFAPISIFASGANGIFVHPATPATTIEQFVDLARSRPGGLTTASPGAGTTAHVTQEYFKLRTGANLVHVPYRGSGALLPDLLGGQVASVIDNLPPYMEHVQAGRLRLLAVTTAQPSPSAPEVPTLAATVAPGFDAAAWFGLLGPAGTPEAVSRSLNQVCAGLLTDSGIVSRIRQSGAEPSASSPEAFAELLRQELARWTEVVRISGARMD